MTTTTSMFWMDLAQTRDATIVEVRADVDNLVTYATGTARRHPDDKHDATIGTLLASSRALDSLARKLGHRARGLVKHADDVRSGSKNPRSVFDASMGVDRRYAYGYIGAGKRVHASQVKSLPLALYPHLAYCGAGFIDTFVAPSVVRRSIICGNCYQTYSGDLAFRDLI